MNKAPSTAQGKPQEVASGSQNRLFQLNKQIILTARKLETGPLENYVHMATLIHKLNLLLLEFDSVKQLRTILRIIFSRALLNSIVDFCMNADQFAHFGVRLIEIMAVEYHKEIARSEAVAVVFGLLRTQDYETVVQCLSFLKVLLQTSLSEIPTDQKPGSPPVVRVGEILTKKLLLLVMKTVAKAPEVEYIAILVDIVNLVITDPDQRQLIVSGVVKEEDVPDDDGPFTYRRLLKNFEAQLEVRAIKHLHQRVTRQLKEVEMWTAASKAKPPTQKK